MSKIIQFQAVLLEGEHRESRDGEKFTRYKHKQYVLFDDGRLFVKDSDEGRDDWIEEIIPDRVRGGQDG